MVYKLVQFPLLSSSYKNRNDKEARAFIIKLIEDINLANNSTVLDLGCGKGRHSFVLNKKYEKVIGIDLSTESIKEAKKTPANGLSFIVQDMRKFQLKEKVNGIFNLFTSFGYFETIEDNIKVLQQCNKHLKKDGLLIIDFFNAYKVKSTLIEEEIKTIDKVCFNIKREIINNFVIKTINFEDKNQQFSFEEKVQLLSLEDFKTLFFKSNFKLIRIFGGYDLENFEPENSNRLILIAKKI